MTSTIKNATVQAKLAELTTPRHFTAENSRVAYFLETLMRIPADVALSVSSRDMVMQSGNACLLGWTVRDHILLATGVELPDLMTSTLRDASIRLIYGDRTTGRIIADNVADDAYELCLKLYGGDVSRWSEIYHGVTDEECGDIELAWLTRLDLAATEGI